MELKVRKLSLDDDLNAIGRLIYHTDPYIYPALFENNIENATKVAPFLVNTDSYYNYKNISICLVDGVIAGYMVVLKNSSAIKNREAFKEAFMKAIGYVPPRFDEVMDGYCDLIVVHEGTNEVLSVAVLPEFRRMGVANALLESLDAKTTYRLACIKANDGARKLYENNGFVYDLDYPGFIGIPCVELVKKSKEDIL